MGDEVREQTTAVVSDLNPYDFRYPVTEAENLAARGEELEQARNHLDGAAQGRPVHIALIGPRAAGKTSLLRVLQSEATHKGFLAVRVDLDEGVTATAATFFKAVFEAVVLTLVAAGALAEDDPRYTGWVRQVMLGDTTINPADQLLLFGMVAASMVSGGSHPDVSPALLARDCQRLAELAFESRFRGIVLLCDEGDLIGENAALIQKLRNLLQALQSWMLIVAGTSRMFDTLSDVFSPIPRQFVRILVGPFRTAWQTKECIDRPLARYGQRARISWQTVRDIHDLTGGSPYEINLVCFHIWEQLKAGRQREFGLSTEVLDAVLAEIRDFGRQVSASEIEIIRTMTETDIRIAARILPLANYSSRQIAFSRLVPRELDEVDLDDEMRKVDADLRRLEELRLVDIEDDRFSVRGDTFVQIYFKYAAHVFGEELPLRPMSYPEHLVLTLYLAAFMERMDKGGADLDEMLMAADQQSYAIDDSRFGRRVGEVGASFASKDLRRIAENPVYPRVFDRDALEGREDRGLLFLGVASVVDLLTPVESVIVALNDCGYSDNEWAEAVEEWFKEHAEFLRSYGVEVQQVVTASLDGPGTRQLAAMAELSQANARVGQMYATGSLIDAVASAVKTVNEQTDYVGDLEYLPAFREELADLHNREGFIRLVLGDVEGAVPALDRAVELGRDHARWLHNYNLAYVHAVRGEYAEAAEIVENHVLPIFDDEDVARTSPNLLMVADLPASADWPGRQDKWNVLELEARHLRAFFNLQVHAWKHKAGVESPASCDRAAEALDPSAPRDLHRLAGWMQLAFLDDPRAAMKHFEAACAEPRPSATCVSELQWARTLAGEVDVPEDGESS